MNKAGNFEITVSDPYPVWCQLRLNGDVVASLTHKELSDLKYVVDKAMREAYGKLDEKDRHEVGL